MPSIDMIYTMKNYDQNKFSTNISIDMTEKKLEILLCSAQTLMTFNVLRYLKVSRPSVDFATAGTAGTHLWPQVLTLNNESTQQ